MTVDEKFLALTELARRSFKLFVKLFWKTVEPTSEFQPSWYTDAICDHLTAVANGEIRNLLINIPPRHGKSTLVAVLFPAWVWLQYPSKRFLCSSYGLQLSIRDSVKCRRLIESPGFKAAYAHLFTLTSDQNQKQRFDNNATGCRLATSVESANIGEGADIILADDPNNISEVVSEAERIKVINWWREVMATRLNDPRTGSKVIIQQRCHEHDLSGWIRDNDHNRDWTSLTIPLEWQGDKAPNRFGWTDPRTEPNEVLSKRIPKHEIQSLKYTLGTAAFSAQYNQSPAPQEGNLFKKEHFRYYDQSIEGSYTLEKRVIGKANTWRFCTVDLAISTKSQADYTVIQVWDATAYGDMMLVHQQRERIDGTKIIPYLKAIDKVYNPHFIGIEDVAFQKLVIQSARQEGLAIKPLKAEGDKMARSIPAQVRFESGQIWFPKDKPWLHDLETELLTFPNARHDDCIDALAYACIEVAKRSRKVQTVDITPEDRQQWEERKRRELLLQGIE